MKMKHIYINRCQTSAGLVMKWILRNLPEASLRNSKTYRFGSADMEYINVNKSTFGSILLFC